MLSSVEAYTSTLRQAQGDIRPVVRLSLVEALSLHIVAAKAVIRPAAPMLKRSD